MKLKSIFKKTPVTKPEVKEAASKVKPEVPEGLLKRCNKCGKGIFTGSAGCILYLSKVRRLPSYASPEKDCIFNRKGFF